MKKSHPIRRTLLATAATVSGIVLLLSLKPASDPAGSVQAAPQQTAGVPSAQGGQGAAAGAQTLTGKAVQTQYGPVQVKITVTGGKVTQAEAVQAPSGGRSTEISGNAVPKLNQAAVTAGTADIDAVSGATYTSAGYKESLQSALDQAGSAQGSGSGEAQAGGDTQESGGGGADTGGGAATGTQVLTGSVAQTQYGPVQVRVTVVGGKITQAEALQSPSGGRSTQISGTAIPQLNKNAVAAGSADIDAVSGATYTTGGYKESLQSALDQAG